MATSERRSPSELAGVVQPVFCFYKKVRMFAVSGEAIQLTGTKASGLCPDLDEMLGRLSTQHILYISEKLSFAMCPALTGSTRLFLCFYSSFNRYLKTYSYVCAYKRMIISVRSHGRLPNRSTFSHSLSFSLLPFGKVMKYRPFPLDGVRSDTQTATVLQGDYNITC